MLYELLTGSTPVSGERLRASGFAEIQRIIREEEAPKPSTRLSTLGEKLAIVASQRKTDESSLRKNFADELDWIVMKTLDKERGRRYGTASDLAVDVQRFLDGEAVAARPATFVYKTRKFWARNKAVCWAVSIAFLALTIGMAALIWGLVDSNRSRNHLESVVKSLDKELLSKALNASFSGDVELTELTISELRSTGMYQSPEKEQELLFLNGLSLTFSGQSQQAIKLFDSVPDDEKTIAAWAGLLWATGDVGDFERMSRCILRMQDGTPKDDFERMLQAVCRTHADPEFALQNFDELVEKHKHWGVLYLFRAVSLGELAKSEPDRAVALAKFTQAIEDYSHAEFLLGRTLFLESSALNGVVDALTYAREHGFDHEFEQWTRIARIYYEHARIDNAKEALGLPLTNRIAYEIFFGLEQSLDPSNKHPNYVFPAAFAKAEALPINNDNKWKKTVEICNGIFEVDRSKSGTDARQVAHRHWQGYFQTEREYVVDADVLALDLFLLAGDLNSAQDKARFLLSKKTAFSSHWYRRNLELIANPTQENINKSKVLAGKYHDDCSFAYYTIGMIHLSRGSRTEAIKAFSEVQKTGNINWWNNTWSKAFLQRMDADKEWPGWIHSEVDRELNMSND